MSSRLDTVCCKLVESGLAGFEVFHNVSCQTDEQDRGIVTADMVLVALCHQKGVQQREQMEQKRAIMFRMLEDIEE